MEHNLKQNWKPGNMLYPLPAVMVSCARPGEKPNIITIAWAGTICSDPAMVSISVQKIRYSHQILAETGEFVINLVPEELCRAMDYCGVRSGRDHDKFSDCGLTAQPAPNLTVAPLIKESPVNIECKVEQVLELGSHDMFIARVVGVQVEDSLMDEKGRLDLGLANLIAYSHGEYARLGKKIGSFGYSVKKKKGNKKWH